MPLVFSKPLNMRQSGLGGGRGAALDASVYFFEYRAGMFHALCGLLYLCWL